MKQMRLILGRLCWSMLCFPIPMWGQTASPIQVSILATVGDEALICGDSVYAIGTDTYQFSMLKFYLSGFQLLHDGEVVWTENNSYHLIHWDEVETRTFTFSVPPELAYDACQFHLGIDSATNASGIFGGDLDPTNGMYWSWNTGYINFKLEGKSNASPSRKQQFFYHLGGYLPPHYGLQTIQQALESTENLYLKLDLANALRRVDMTQTFSIMSPSEAAVDMAAIFAQSFEVYATHP